MSRREHEHEREHVRQQAGEHELRGPHGEDRQGNQVRYTTAPIGA